MDSNKLGDLEKPRLGDDFKRHPHHPQLPSINPQDGLPQMTTSLTMQDALAPPLEIETLVCMGDESVFVIRDFRDQVVMQFSPDRVQRTAAAYGGVWYIESEVLTGDELRKIDELKVYPERLLPVLAYGVVPLRPQCEHYRRVMMDFEGSDAAKSVERVCTAQRTEAGEFTSLRDTRVYACEHRAPRDFVSEQRLRDFDAKRVEDAKKTVEDWDAEAALAAAAQGERTL